MMPQTVRFGTQEVVITPAEAEDGSFVASVRGGKHAAHTFGSGRLVRPPRPPRRRPHDLRVLFDHAEQPESDQDRQVD